MAKLVSSALFNIEVNPLILFLQIPELTDKRLRVKCETCMKLNLKRTTKIFYRFTLPSEEPDSSVS
jgi:hypothetical protein